MTSTLSKRTLGREYAFKFIYKLLLNDFASEKSEIVNDSKALEEALTTFDESFHEEDNEHPDNVVDIHSKLFARQIIIGALRAEDQNLKLIEKHLASSSLARVEKMNLAVLLLGSYEILSDLETPVNVFINEYVNITKKYCPNDSHGFVNSVLDKIAKQR